MNSKATTLVYEATQNALHVVATRPCPLAHLQQTLLEEAPTNTLVQSFAIRSRLFSREKEVYARKSEHSSQP